MLIARVALRQRGVTLIELMTTLSVVSVLAAVATPSFTGFLRNTEVRGSAESMLQGLQLARTEAIRRNARVCFDWTGNGTGWVVSTGCLNAPGAVASTDVIQSQSDREGSSSSVVALSPSTAQRVAFNGLGRVVPNAVGGASIATIDITAARAAMRRRILVSVGDWSGRIFVCDPAVTSGLQMSCS